MLLEKLCNAFSPSSYEGEIREIIKNEIKDYVDEIKVDRMGNIIARKKGSGKRIVLDAHMDEVGFIITGYNEDGTLKFTSLGSIDSKIAPCKVVSIGENKISGVIGLKAIHLQGKDERENNIQIDKLAIDIGAISKEEAKGIVSIGEGVSFTTEFSDFGEGYLKGKALDNRLGCGVLIEVLKENYDCDIYAVFTVQKEIGNRGAMVSAYNTNTDVAIILESTVCSDMPNIDERFKSTRLKKGPSISIMNTTSIFDSSMVEDIKNSAIDLDIPHQIRKSTDGDNDAGSYLMTGKGAQVATISVPCRYVHSAVSVCSLDDYKNTIKLVKGYLRSL